MEQANAKSEWMWRVYFLTMIIVPISAGILGPLSVLICWMRRGNIDTQYLYRPFRISYVEMHFFRLFVKFQFFFEKKKFGFLFWKFGKLEKKINWNCRFRLPWNQTSALGYAQDLFVEVLIGEAYMIFNGSFLLLFISICLHHQAFYKIFQLAVRKLDFSDRNQSDETTMCQLIRFHILVKE